MKRQRKRNPMTIRYVLLGIVLLIGEIGGLIVGSASIFEMVTLDLIVFVPIIIKRFKYNTDLGNILRSPEKAYYINGFHRSNGAYYTTITPFAKEL